MIRMNSKLANKKKTFRGTLCNLLHAITFSHLIKKDVYEEN